MLLLICVLYACRAVYRSGMIRFSLVLLPFDIMSNMLLESLSTCTGIGCLKTNSNGLRIASASSNTSAKATTSANSTERATHRDFYYLYETCIALWLSSVRKTMRISCDDKSALLANAASLYAVILSEL